MDTFIDTSIIVPAIIETPDSEAIRGFIETSLNRLVVSPIIYQEALHVGTKILLRERCGIESVAAVRKFIRKNGYDCIFDFIERLNILFMGFTIYADSTNTLLISQIAAKYHLLSGDALIIATCVENNIQSLASFDSDFKNIDGISLLFQ